MHSAASRAPQASARRRPGASPARSCSRAALACSRRSARRTACSVGCWPAAKSLLPAASLLQLLAGSGSTSACQPSTRPSASSAPVRSSNACSCAASDVGPAAGALSGIPAAGAAAFPGLAAAGCAAATAEAPNPGGGPRSAGLPPSPATTAAAAMPGGRYADRTAPGRGSLPHPAAMDAAPTCAAWATVTAAFAASLAAAAWASGWPSASSRMRRVGPCARLPSADSCTQTLCMGRKVATAGPLVTSTTFSCCGRSSSPPSAGSRKEWQSR